MFWGKNLFISVMCSRNILVFVLVLLWFFFLFWGGSFWSSCLIHDNKNIPHSLFFVFSIFLYEVLTKFEFKLLFTLTLKSSMKLLNRSNLGINIRSRQRSIECRKSSLFSIIVTQRGSLGMETLQSCFESVFVVIWSLDQRLSGHLK